MLKSKIMSLAEGGVYIEWKGGQRLLQTGKTDLLLAEEEIQEKWVKGRCLLTQGGERGHRSQEAGDQASGQAPQGEGVGEHAG